MLPAAILFDMDDTLISYDGVVDAAWKQVCDSFAGSRRIPWDSGILLEGINKKRGWFWSDPERHRTGRLDLVKARREIVKMALEELKCPDEAAAFEIADKYSRLHEEMICLFPDSICTLERLRDLNIRMALITNGSSEKQRTKIERFGFGPFFEFCLVEEEVGFGKPDVRVFQLALEKLALKAGEVWMVGDNLVWDVEAPQSAGIYSIWVDANEKGLPANSAVKPDRIIKTISELLE